MTCSCRYEIVFMDLFLYRVPQTNRQINRIILVLVMGTLFISLPAQAAHAGQSGSSLPVTHQNTVVNDSPVLPATNSPLSVEKVYGTDSGSSVSLPVPVQQSPYD
jgi:hypothetical protein